MKYSILKYEEESGIGKLIISRSEALNALNELFFSEFNDFLDSVQSSRTLRVLIITGEGKAFVAGADIGEMGKLDTETGYIFSKKGQITFTRIESLPFPVIAAVNGFALGGGCELVMACDIRIASSKAKFGMPEVSLGVIPGYGGTKLLLQITGKGDAMMMILTGQMIEAAEAYRIGFIQKITEPEMLMDEVMSVASRIASNSPAAVRRAKRMIRMGINMTAQEALDLEALEFSKMFGIDGNEGMKAFLEKRKADWKPIQ